MRPGIEIDGHSPLPHRTKLLRAPGAARLTIANRLLASDPLHIKHSLTLAAIKFRNAIVPALPRKKQSRCRLNAVEIRVVADLVLLNRVNHIRPATLFEHSGLLAHQLVSTPDSLGRQKLA